MRTFTKEDFDAFPVDQYLRKVCPTGDYSQIARFYAECAFGSGCKFADGTVFSACCDFGSRCVFGDRISMPSRSCFGSRCVFGSSCSFGTYCSFSEGSVFKSNCTFDFGCSFGQGCCFETGAHFPGRSSFGAACLFEGARFHSPHFGSKTDFGGTCYINGHMLKQGDYPMLAIAGAGSVKRTTYFYNCVDGIYVVSGCFFGPIHLFREKTLQDVSADTVKAKQYLGFADIAELTFGASQ